jgi:UDP-N-acetylmuramoyl-L-alanyl-D-glutamate--2,6-diaminopimelate ligase
MRLRKLLMNFECISVKGNIDTEISAIVYDSNKITPGALFVCLKGLRFDGHQFAQEAVKQGAKALIVEDIPEFTTNAAIIQVADTRKALAYFSALWFGYPAEKMKMIGITGTKGKTTASHMMKGILEEAGYKVGMIGTLGAYIGEERIPTANTTPESYELHSLFEQMRKSGCSYVVMEASSQGFKQKRTEGIIFDYGVFLNISPDHIAPGEHDNFQEYLDCKRMLFRQSKKILINRDTQHWDEVTKSVEKPFLFSLKMTADLTADNIENIWEQGRIGSSFSVYGGYEGKISLNLPGVYNVENALAAIGIAYMEKIKFSAVSSALSQITVKGRTQVIKETSHFSTFIIDYAHNALSMENLLVMLKDYHPRRLICLFGGGGNRSKQRRLDMGRIAGKYADLSIITTDNPRMEKVESINNDIIEGINGSNGNYEIILDREKAIHYLIDNCKKDDIIALIGKGHEEYQEIKGQKYYFSEKKIIEQYLKKK